MFKRRWAILSLVFILSLGVLPQAFTQEPSREELLNRVSTLEKEVQELKAIITQVQSKQEAVVKKVETGEEKSQQISQAVQAEGKAIDGNFLTSQHKVKLYGFLKLDTTLDDSKTDNPDAARYAISEATTEDEAQYAMTAQNSRLGLKYYGPQLDDGEVYGNVELDFFDTASDNSQQLRMRHAFFELQFPKWSLLAGQTWDVFGPLGPNSLNTNGYLWNGGNIGFRRPQVRLTNYFEFDKERKITSQVSVNRNIGVGNGSVNSGENSGYPLVEGRLAYTFPFLGKSSTVGVAGLYGREEYNRNDNVTESSYQVPQWAVGLDAVVPINKWLSFRGEFFHGKNLDAFLAGIGQGINTTTESAVGTTGGWAQATLTPWEKGAFNFGYGVDDANQDDLNSSNRSKSQVLFANFIYPVLKNIDLGFEYSHFETDYIGQDKGDNNRYATSLIYNF